MKLGICYRPHLHKKFLSSILNEVSILEIMPEVTDVIDMKEIAELCFNKNIEMGLHCLRTSLFSPEGVQKQMLEKYFYISEYIHSKYFSDHIAISYYHQYYLTSVQPISYTPSNIEVFKNNYDLLKQYFSDSILIENITQHEPKPDSSMTESNFIRSITDEIEEVEILFDVTNMYITSKNLGIEFSKYVENFPFDKIKVIHVSGLTIKEGRYLDTHSEKLSSEILAVVDSIKDKCTNLEYVLVERDFNINSEKDVLDDLKELASIFKE